MLPQVTIEDVEAAGGDWEQLRPAAHPGDDVWFGAIGPEEDDPDNLALNLAGSPDWSAVAFARAREMGPEAIIDQIEASGLQGRGGAGFPAHIKWRGTLNQPASTPLHGPERRRR